MSLKELGYEVIVAGTGTEAVEAASGDRGVDLVLMDIDLGDGMDGTEAAELILRRGDLPVVFLSSHTEPEVVEMTRRITSYGYVVKNSGPAVLDASIRMALKLFEVRQSLRASEEKHRRLFETISQGIVYQAMDGSIVSANPAAERMLGLTLDQMRGRTSHDLRWRMIREDGSSVPGSEHPTMIALRTGRQVGPVVRGVSNPQADGYVWLLVTAIPLFHPGDERPFQVYATFDDITARRAAEKALDENADLYRAAFLDMPIPVGFINRTDGSIIFNAAFSSTYGYQPADLPTIRSWWHSAYPDEAYRAAVRRTWEEAKSKAEQHGSAIEAAEYQIQDKWGRHRVVQISGVKVQHYLVVVFLDLTDRIRAEQEVRTLLGEKETLLREVHHRIKNSIALVEGLLAVPAGTVENPEAATILEGTIGRVRSVRLLYDALLVGDDYRAVSLVTYLERVVQLLSHLFPEGVDVVFEHADDIPTVDPRRLVSIGIIVNELVTNAMKHAFADRVSGTVKVIVTREADRVKLSIEDDGRGLSEEAATAGGMGMTLVRMLSDQIDGTLTIEVSHGTRTVITFDP